MGRSSTTQSGPLPTPEVRTDEKTLTSFAGLVPLVRFLDEQLEIPARLKHVVAYNGRRRRYAVHLVLYAFVVTALAGVVRLAHIEALSGDPVLLKFLRLPSWPIRKVFSRALASLDDLAMSRLHALLTATGLWTCRQPERLIIDFDSTSLVLFGRQQGAFFGYSGKGRNKRRHHPVVASLAHSRTVVHALYRDGSALDASKIIDFFHQTLLRVRDALANPELPVFIRADSGFWSHPVRDWCFTQKIPFFFSLRLLPHIKCKLPHIHFLPVDDDGDLQVARVPGDLLGLDPRLFVACIRRRVHDPKAPPAGKKVSDSPSWRYQSIVTSEDWSALDIWRFYNDRADCERIFRTARGGLGLGWLVSHDFRANSAAFLLRLLAFNLDLLFQAHVEQRARHSRAPVRQLGLLHRQQYFYRCPGRLLRQRGRWVLRTGVQKLTNHLWAYYAPELLAPS